MKPACNYLKLISLIHLSEIFSEPNYHYNILGLSNSPYYILHIICTQRVAFFIHKKNLLEFL